MTNIYDKEIDKDIYKRILKNQIRYWQREKARATVTLDALNKRLADIE